MIIKNNFLTTGNINIYLPTLENIVRNALKSYSSFDVLNKGSLVSIVDGELEINIEIKLNVNLKTIRSILDLLEKDIETKIFFFSSVKPSNIKILVK